MTYNETMLFFWIGYINLFYALAGLALLVLTLLLIIDYCVLKSVWYERWLRPYVWAIIALITVGSVATSLLYSEYFGFVPCSLCWLQRIAIYPQALLSLVAWKVRDEVFFPLYGIALSGFGFLVAVYHYIYQLIPKEAATGIMPCLADGTADCGTKVINEFGFVTFPFLSAVTFAFLMVVYLNMRREVHRRQGEL